VEEVCGVCGKLLDEIYAVSCIGCGGKIHFPAAENVKDNCGSIVTQWNICGLAFVCKKCSAVQKPFGDVKVNP
jgi:hypothetical protein